MSSHIEMKSYQGVAKSEDVEANIDTNEIVPVDNESSRNKRAYTFSPAAPDNAPSILTFESICVTSKKDPSRFILKNLNGSVTGGMWAIMGPSGSGKTTLLSTLSLRLDTKHMDISGSIRLNGREYNKQILKSMSAYVMQDDILHAELTVLETLRYASELRMPSQFTAEDRAKRVEEVMEIMGVSHVRNVVIGDSRVKGISGGERKRVCIAIELLTKPKLIFLDEPTSGLDSSTALSVCETLKRISEMGECTVVCTIHQPQPKIFALFDNLILMKRGNIVYQGSCSKTMLFLESLGMPCPEGANPADHLIDVISADRRESLAERVEEQARKVVPVDLSLGFDKGGFTERTARSWIDQYTILFRRNWQQYMRRKDIILINIATSVILSTFVGMGIWHQIGTTQTSVPRRVPSLFFGCVTQGVLASLQTINSFPKERAVMLRERASGAYYVSSYYMAKSTVDMFFQLANPIIFSIMVYNMIGYQPHAKNFFIYMGFMILDTFAATSLATAVSCCCVSIELSTVILSVLFEISRLYGGFFTSPKMLDDYPHWRFADALSYIKYAFIGVALNELEGLELSCTPAQVSSKKCIPNGETTIELNGYDEYTIGFAAGILIVYIVGCRIVGLLGLRFIKV